MTGKKTHPPKSDYARGDNTLEFKLQDPKLDKVVQLADKESAKIERYRRFFARHRLAHSNDRQGLNYEVFVDNLSAGGSIMLGSQQALLFFTRSAAFIMFSGMPDFGYLGARFPQVDFVGKTSMIEPKSGGSPTALVRVTGAEILSILHPSAGDPDDYLEAALAAQRIRMVRTMLADCTVEAGGLGMSLRDFSERIVICEHLDDRSGSKSYLVGLEGEDSLYTISADPKDASCRLGHQGDACYIKKQELI